MGRFEAFDRRWVGHLWKKMEGETPLLQIGCLFLSPLRVMFCLREREREEGDGLIRVISRGGRQGSVWFAEINLLGLLPKKQGYFGLF